MKKPVEVLSIGTAASTKIPRYELIPKPALAALASRFEVGVERHKEKAWNSLSPNFDTALTREWVIARLAHAVDHAYNALAKLHSGVEDGEDDAGAIMFAGSVLACYKSAAKAAGSEEPISEPIESLNHSRKCTYCGQLRYNKQFYTSEHARCISCTILITKRRKKGKK